MPSPSFLITVEIEVMADDFQKAEQGVQAALDNMVGGDILSAGVSDVEEIVPLKD